MCSPCFRVCVNEKEPACAPCLRPRPLPLPGCLPACLPADLPAWLPGCLATWLPACLSVCLSVCVRGASCPGPKIKLFVRHGDERTCPPPHPPPPPPLPSPPSQFKLPATASRAAGTELLPPCAGGGERECERVRTSLTPTEWVSECAGSRQCVSTLAPCT